MLARPRNPQKKTGIYGDALHGLKAPCFSVCCPFCLTPGVAPLEVHFFLQKQASGKKKKKPTLPCFRLCVCSLLSLLLSSSSLSPSLLAVASSLFIAPLITSLHPSTPPPSLSSFHCILSSPFFISEPSTHHGNIVRTFSFHLFISSLLSSHLFFSFFYLFLSPLLFSSLLSFSLLFSPFLFSLFFSSLLFSSPSLLSSFLLSSLHKIKDGELFPPNPFPLP